MKSLRNKWRSGTSSRDSVTANHRWCVAAITLSLVLTPIGHAKRSLSLNSVSTAPQILLDNSGPDLNQAATLDSVCFSRDPFHVHLPFRCWLGGADQNTRVTIFVANVAAGTPVTVNLVDARGQSFTVNADNVLEVANSDFLQITFSLPDQIEPGPCDVSVTASGIASNSAKFRIAFEAEHWQQDLQLLASQLPLLHVNPFTKITKQQFDDAVAELDADIPNLQDHEIVTRMMQIVASIGDAHTSLNTNGSRLRFRTYPIQTYWFTDGLFVTSIASAYTAALGKSLIQVGTTDINEVNSKVSTVISHENDQWVKAQAPARIASPETLQALRVLPDLQTGTLVVRDSNGQALPVNINSVFANQTINWVSLPDPDQVATPLYRQHPELNYWFDYIDSAHTLYFQYNVCQNRTDLPFNQFLQQLQNFSATHQIDKFVVDLRNNTGGDSSILQPLINGLASDPNINRSDRLFVIVGRLTISSGLLNAIDLRQRTHATFVGEATGGKPNHFGEVGSFRLPNSQLSVSYAKRFFNTVAGDPSSLFPDTNIELSSADFFAGRDPVLQNILNR